MSTTTTAADAAAAAAAATTTTTTSTTYFTDGGARVSPDCFNALGIIRRLQLVPGLVHIAHVSLLRLENARQVDLQTMR